MPWQRLSRSNGRTLQGGSGRERELGGEFFLLDRLQALDWQRLRKAKGREMAIKEVFGPAEADATTRWKWRRKLLERLISEMEMARS
jgi:hypothetical protein